MGNFSIFIAQNVQIAREIDNLFIFMKITIKLSPEEVLEIIAAHFKGKPIEIDQVTPKLVDISGYGGDYEFDGFEIQAKLLN
jgi:hypothetical protein